MAYSQVVQVSGIPPRLYEDDLVEDKLLIHFLRRRNGGGCDVTVRYPTEEEGVAILTFELEEVARSVLGRKHILEIEGCTYPVEVRRPQFSMPIRTTLRLRYFNDVPEVKRLVERCNLRIVHERSSRLYLEGDFRDLRRCRDELYNKFSVPHSQQVVENETLHAMKDPTGSRPASGEKNRGSPKNRNSPSSLTSHRRPNNASELTGPSTTTYTKFADDPTSRQREGSSTNPANYPSPRAANESSSRLTSGKSSTSIHLEKVSPPNLLSRSFLVDSGVHTYIKIFEKTRINDILSQYFVDMKEEKCGTFNKITLTTKSPYLPTFFEEAHKTISGIFANYQECLWRENLIVPNSSQKSKEEVTKNIQQCLFNGGIWSMANKNSIHLIGPSDRIHEFMQKWNGTQGSFAQLISEGERVSAFSRPPAEGIQQASPSPHSKTFTQTQAGDGKPRARDSSQGASSRGTGGQQEANVRGTSANSPKPWR